MQDKIARQVHQVFGYGLELKERLERGDRPHFEAEQTKLRGLLLGDSELRYIPEYAGELASQTAQNIRTSQGAMRGAEPFLGIRYALTCWVDEIFISDSPWRDQWTESMLEVTLYGGSSLRGVRFWEQAKKAEARPGTDGLEVFLWCVMLGFRGEPAAAGINPPQWIEGVRKRVLTGYAQEFAQPQEKDPPTFVPVLRGRERFGTMLRVAAAFAAVIAFAVTFFLFKGQAGQ
jgi:type IV/VI secretion system ImpK/VasF family protein